MNSEHPISFWISNILGTGAIASSILGLIPPFAALVALVWYFIQISESRPVQRWVLSRRTRKLAKLKAEVIMLEAKLAHADALPPLPPR